MSLDRAGESNKQRKIRVPTLFSPVYANRMLYREYLLTGAEITISGSVETLRQARKVWTFDLQFYRACDTISIS